jgi:hypothetical protein
LAVSIYALTDPRTGQIRYIGKAKDPEKRYKQHIVESMTGVPYRKCAWIRALLESGEGPGLVVLQKVSDLWWEHAERRWIASERNKGDHMVNYEDGGESPPPARWGRRWCAGPTKYRGVTWCSEQQKWKAWFFDGKRTVTVGRFRSEYEAAIARDAAVLESGIDVPLNFNPPRRREMEKPRGL